MTIKTFENLSPLKAEIAGSMLVLSWRNAVILKLGLGSLERMSKEVLDTAPSDLADSESPGKRDAFRMAQAFSAVRMKYSGRGFIAKPGSKYWPSIVKAAEMAKEMGVQPEIWCEAITDRLSAMRNETTLPWPSQLSGDSAVIWVTSYLAAQKSMPTKEGAKLARLNAGIPLNQDEEFHAIKRRMKEKSHTKADMEYLKHRLNEVKGRLPEWFPKYEATAQ